jgi:signal transduction histidine kinase
MKLQAKLTLGSVALATVLVTLISAFHLGNLMQIQFNNTLERAEPIRDQATAAVREALNRQRNLTLPEALQDPTLQARLVELLASYKALIEIALVSADTGQVLASTTAEHVGQIIMPPDPDFAALVHRASWREELSALLRREGQSYRLDGKLGSNEVTLLYVRVLVNPALIRDVLDPAFRRSASLAVISIAGAVLVTFLASTLAFQALGRISRMLDLVARGEYEAEKVAPAERKRDELSVIESKVGLLGQRLRGAQDEASGLRVNIDRLLADLEEAVLLFDRTRRLVYASGSVEKLLGQGRGELSGCALDQIFPLGKVLGDLLDQAVVTGSSLRNRRVPFGTPPVVVVSLDMLADSGFVIRLRNPEAQRQIKGELRTADRMAAISRISGGVAHEVKNPLNAILLHVEVARAKLGRGDTDVASEMEIISREILRLDRVVRTFLDFSRPVELQQTNRPVHELVDEIVDLAQPQARAAGIRIEVEHEADGVEVRVDADLIKQAVLNVVGNAIEAMPEGGVLGLDARVAGEMAELRVTDTGEGIPPELREKIFKLYYSTKPKGSGIGLAMTFRIVQLHDGTIDFTSEPGKGTTFLIRLPIAV